MKKVLIALLVIVMIAASVGAVYFYLEMKKVTKEKDVLVIQNGQLQTTIQNIGPIVEVFTVQTKIFPGKELKETDLVMMSIPQSSTNENFLLSKDDIIGMEAKVELNPGTPLTSDVVMLEFLEAPVYERDLVCDSIPIGLRVGDYIDVRLVLPAGEEYGVLAHKRVHFIQDNIIKLHLTEAELALWTSAWRDLSIYRVNGLSIYYTKYIEPGIIDTPVTFYPVREDMISIVNFNPNIRKKEECINIAIRADLEDRLREMLNRQQMENATWSGIASGVAQEHAALMAGQKVYITENESSAAEETLYAPSDASPASVYNEGADASGNVAGISEELQSAAEGSNVFGDEKPIG